MRRHDSDLDHLAAIPLFGGCSKNELQLISQKAERVTFTKGGVLTKQGSLGYEFFVITEGEAEVSRDGKVVATLGPGEYAGELALLDREPRNATVTAKTDLKVIVLGYQEFWSVISGAPGLDKKLLIAMAKRLRAAETPAVLS
ncbi:MAG TPA: cyclic nucleotide-binding domain-containing protein [Mycobacteriales bacterium]|nr:cyclic nucleotide-binding domain-containing protein [Mycobacteriales bacterium]